MKTKLSILLIFAAFCQYATAQTIRVKYVSEMINPQASVGADVSDEAKDLLKNYFRSENVLCHANGESIYSRIMENGIVEKTEKKK